jgi:hypothetical protein
LIENGTLLLGTDAPDGLTRPTPASSSLLVSTRLPGTSIGTLHQLGCSGPLLWGGVAVPRSTHKPLRR